MSKYIRRLKRVEFIFYRCWPDGALNINVFLRPNKGYILLSWSEEIKLLYDFLSEVFSRKLGEYKKEHCYRTVNWIYFSCGKSYFSTNAYLKVTPERIKKRECTEAKNYYFKIKTSIPLAWVELSRKEMKSLFYFLKMVKRKGVA